MLFRSMVIVLKLSESISSSWRTWTVLCSDASVSGNYCAPVSGFIWAVVVAGQFHSCWSHCWEGSGSYLRMIGILSVFKCFFFFFWNCIFKVALFSTGSLESHGAQGVILVQLLTCFASCYSSGGASFPSEKWGVF